MRRGKALEKSIIKSTQYYKYFLFGEFKKSGPEGRNSLSVVSADVVDCVCLPGIGVRELPLGSGGWGEVGLGKERAKSWR